MAETVEVVRRMLELARLEAERTEQPQELCGFLVTGKDGSLELIQCPNVHKEPTQYFEIDANLHMDLASTHEIVAFWHTHPNGDAAPSEGDLVMIEALDLPSHIVSWPQAGHSYTEPTGYQAPYEGRPFVHGVLDCYSIIRDWYQREYGVELKDFDRNDRWWEGKDAEDLYVKNFESQGFYDRGQDSTDLQPGDVILMQLGKDVERTNHGAVYIGDGYILHHLWGKLSAKAIYGGFWRKNTTHILRHKTRT